MDIYLFISYYRLQMEYVDLFLIHSPYGGRNVDTYQALLDLKKKGVIRYSILQCLHNGTASRLISVIPVIAYTHVHTET